MKLLSVLVLLLLFCVLLVRPGYGNEDQTQAQAVDSTRAQLADQTNGRDSSELRVSWEAPGRQSSVEPPYRVVLRSLVYPGWGQLYNKKYVKGLVVFASEAALLGMIYTESRQASDAYDDHLAAHDPVTAERLYAEYERHFNRRDSLVWWTAGMVLLSLADAYVDANLITFEEEFGEPQKKAEISLTGGSYQNGGFVGLKCIF